MWTITFEACLGEFVSWGHWQVQVLQKRSSESSGSDGNRAEEVRPNRGTSPGWLFVTLVLDHQTYPKHRLFSYQTGESYLTDL